MVEENQKKTLIIVGLETENVKRLRAVALDVSGENVVIIGGRNAQGKTSLLDAIQMAIGGGKMPDKPVRTGASKASITLDLGDLTVTRTFTARGTQLVVKNAQKEAIMSPQALLDRLTSRVSFDPLAFLKLEPREKAAKLRQIAGVDFGDLDSRRVQLYDDRTAKNREVAQAKALADTAPRHDDTPEAELSVAELAGRLGEAERTVAANDKKRGSLSDANDNVDAAADAVKKAQEELTRAQSSLKLKEEALKRVTTDRDNLKVEITALADPDTAAILRQMEDIEATNRKVRENKAWEQKQQDLKAVSKASADLTEKIEGIDKDKAAKLEAAKFPIEGLSFDETGILYRGEPFDQASAAEQLRVSVAMGLAMNPELKVLLIRDGSLLDSDNLKLIGDMAVAANAQVWIEKVGAGDECSVVIEDGNVLADNTKAAKTSRAAKAAQTPGTAAS